MQTATSKSLSQIGGQLTKSRNMEYSAHPEAAEQDVVAFPGKWLSGFEPLPGCSVGLRVLDSLDKSTKISLQTTKIVVWLV